MASHEEQIQLTTELKRLTDEFATNGAALGAAFKATDVRAVKVLREQQLELKREMDLIRDKLLKEDDMKH